MNADMEYRRIGNSGLKISAISLGNWLNTNDPEEHKSF